MISRLLCSLCFGIFSVFGVGLVAMMLLLLERLEEAAVLLRPERCLTSGPWIINDVFFHGWKVPVFSLVGHVLLWLLEFFLFFELFPVQRWCVSIYILFKGRKSLPHNNSYINTDFAKIYWSNYILATPSSNLTISPCHLASFTLHPPTTPSPKKRQPGGAKKKPWWRSAPAGAWKVRNVCTAFSSAFSFCTSLVSTWKHR